MMIYTWRLIVVPNQSILIKPSKRTCITRLACEKNIKFNQFQFNQSAQSILTTAVTCNFHYYLYLHICYKYLVLVFLHWLVYFFIFDVFRQISFLVTFEQKLALKILILFYLKLAKITHMCFNCLRRFGLYCNLSPGIFEMVKFTIN